MWEIFNSFIETSCLCVLTGLLLGPLFCSMKGEKTWPFIVFSFCIIWRVYYLKVYGSESVFYDREQIVKDYYRWFFCDGILGFSLTGFVCGFAISKYYDYFQRNKGYNPISEREQNNYLEKLLNESKEEIRGNDRYIKYINKEYNTIKCQLSQKDIELNQLKEYLQQNDPKVLENFELYKTLTTK